MRDAAGENGRLLFVVVYHNNLRSVTEVSLEPREGDARDSESVIFKAVDKDGVVGGVEGSGKIEECKKRCFTSWNQLREGDRL